MRNLLGTPAVDTIPFKTEDGNVVPISQVEMVRLVLRRFHARPSMENRLRREYRAACRALVSAGVDLRVLNLDDGDPHLSRWLRGRSIASLRFVSRGRSRWHLFPRDLFVWAEAAGVLVAHSDLFRLRPRPRRGCRIIHSQWAEGGRVLLSGDRLIVGRHPEHPRAPRSRLFDRLRDGGMTVGAVPMPVVCALDRRNGHVLELTHDRHLDRSMALLRDGDGTLHLIVDPGYRTGPLTAPLPVSRSIDLLRRACDRLEVELHVPESISVPYATCAVQLAGGSVLMTGGDAGVLECVREFIPQERVLTTRTPWVAYPVFASAGLHCLVTELPEPLLR